MSSRFRLLSNRLQSVSKSSDINSVEGRSHHHRHHHHSRRRRRNHLRRKLHYYCYLHRPVDFLLDTTNSTSPAALSDNNRQPKRWETWTYTNRSTGCTAAAPACTSTSSSSNISGSAAACRAVCPLSRSALNGAGIPPVVYSGCEIQRICERGVH